jgi:hypothetical protein
MALAIDVPETTVVGSHGLQILVNGQPIGAITRWSVQQSQGTTNLYAFGDDVVGFDHVRPARGEPFENFPGNLTGQTIQFTRFQIYTALTEDVLGTKRLESLTFQNRPLTVREVIQGPGGRFNLVNVYYGVLTTTHQMTVSYAPAEA